MADNPSVGRYRPASLSDFHAYAKDLAWLIEEPLQRGQDLLAKIYGYSGLYELQHVMRSPGKCGFESVSDDRTPSQIEFWTPSIGNRMLDLVAEAKGLDSLKGLSQRCWAVRDIKLFGTGKEHREAFARVRGPILVAHGKEQNGADLNVHDYATIEVDYEGKAIPRFTALGRDVFKAACGLVPDQNGWEAGGRTPPRVAADLDALALRHPNNPWIPAIKVTGLAESYFLGGWADNVLATRESGFTELDADPGFVRAGPENGRWFLPSAKKAITLFKELLGEQADNMADHRLSSSDGDTSTWPSVLYWGARTAAAAGEHGLAMEWARLCMKNVPGDNFGARQLLAPLLLAHGKRGAVRLFKGSDEALGSLVKAIAAATDGEWMNAAVMFAAAASRGIGPIEAFSGRWPDARRGRTIGSNHDLPSFYQEFMYWSAPFWEREARVKLFFQSIAKDKGVRKAALNVYTQYRKTWGMGSGYDDSGDELAEQALVKSATEFARGYRAH